MTSALRFRTSAVLAAAAVASEFGAFRPVPYKSVYLWFDRKLTDLPFWARRYDPTDLNCDFYDMSNINAGWKDRPSVITSNIIWSHRTDGLDSTVTSGRSANLAPLPSACRSPFTLNGRRSSSPFPSRNGAARG